jgi:SAM-dependent methyltransferase
MAAGPGRTASWVNMQDPVQTQLSGETSGYARMHQSEGIGDRYDELIYAAGGHDDFMWSLQRPYLERIVRAQRASLGHVKSLDFACGTGRIVSVVETLVDDATGVDISPFMIEPARRKVTRARLLVADIFEQPDAVDSDYDLITAFRFFLNTEHEMRQRVMSSLAGRLAGPDARLVFNVHGNSHSVMAPVALYKRLRGWGRTRMLSHGEVRRLVEDAGLRIEAWYGFGIWPPRMYRGPLRRFAEATDRLASGNRHLGRFGRDLVFVCRRGE